MLNSSMSCTILGQITWCLEPEQNLKQNLDADLQVKLSLNESMQLRVLTNYRGLRETVMSLDLLTIVMVLKGFPIGACALNRNIFFTSYKVSPPLCTVYHTNLASRLDPVPETCTLLGRWLNKSELVSNFAKST
jgi:hypothetical protein